MTVVWCGSGNTYLSGAPGFSSPFHRGSCYPVICLFLFYVHVIAMSFEFGVLIVPFVCLSIFFTLNNSYIHLHKYDGNTLNTWNLHRVVSKNVIKWKLNPFFKNFSSFRCIFSRHHNTADPISNVLSDMEHSIIAGIYSTCYIFYFLFVHGYIPVREARDFLTPLTLVFEWS